MAVYIGIDWSEKKHDVVCMNEKGAVITQFQIAHSADGFVQLDSKLRKLGVTLENILIGLETAHNLLIDFLWDTGYSQVYVIPPNMTRSCQGRYRQSGARNDASDARLIADLLRTDRHRLYPWHPDSCLTLELRAKVHWFMSLSRSKRRLASQLRAILLRYYPAALQVFGELDSQITLEFIQTYPTPQAAAQLTLAEFKSFVRQHRYPIGKIPGCFACLQAKQPEAARHTVLAYQQEAVQLATLLLQTVRTLAAVQRELTCLFEQHPDRSIFASLPGAGDLLAPGLLVKFGDDRRRFPQANALQALAGTCPVTDQSGQRRRIYFRQACDHEFRHITQQWAKSSIAQSDWASTYFSQALQRGFSTNHAYRCLANRWLAIAWKLWQEGKPYDETYHLQQRAARCRPLH